MRKKDKFVVPVAFICDDDYVMQTAVAITSLIENKKENTRYEITVVGAELSHENIETLVSLSSQDVCVHVVIKNIEPYLELTHGMQKQYVVATAAALLKFELPNIFSGYNKLIYLDGDVIVRDDLKLLYETDVESVYAGVVRDNPQVLYDVPRIELGLGVDYFNSGVMLLNLKKMRADNITEALLKRKKERVNDNLMDQNIFNITFDKKVKQLPLKYNVCFSNLHRSQKLYSLEKLNMVCSSDYNSLSEIEDDAIIIHYSSKDKPWKYFDCPLADEWLYYYKKSPYKDVRLYRNSMIENIEWKPIDEKKEVIPIVFAMNRLYAPYAAVAIESIVEKASKQYRLDIYCLHTELTMQLINKLEEIHGDNYSVKCVNVSRIIDSDLYVCSHFTVEMYYRVLIPEIFSQYKKIIYLDCDLIMNADISLLFNIEIDNAVIAAANNLLSRNMYNYITQRLKINSNNYINSGVLIINVEKFITEKIKDKFFSVLNLRDGYSCPDQDVISLVCQGKIKYLPYEWNFQWHHLEERGENNNLMGRFRDKYLAAEKKYLIMHFSGEIKPWSSPEHKYSELFWELAKKSVMYEQIIINGLKVNQNNEQIEQIRKLKIQNDELNQTNIRYEERSRELENEINRLNSVVSQLEYNTYCLEETRKSFTYKIGRFITFLPRMIREIIRKG